VTATPRTLARNKTIRYITRDDHRIYLHPETGDPLLGVTSVIGNLPKPYLKAWGQKLVATEAVEKHVQLDTLIRTDPEAAVEYLKKTPDRLTARSAKQGKIAHMFFEDLALGNTVSTANEDPEVRMMVDHFKDYLDTLQPTFLRMEEGVYDEDWEYAGTFDAIARYNNPDIIFFPRSQSTGELLTSDPIPLVGVAWQDNKTTRSGVHAEVGLQLAAYRYAKYMIRDDGTTMLNKPGDFAIVVHVRPEGWELIQVEAGPRQLDVFHHLRAIADYTRFGERQVINGRLAGNRETRARVRKGQLQIAAASTDIGELKVVDA
jgi:hypothetical protein